MYPQNISKKIFRKAFLGYVLIVAIICYAFVLRLNYWGSTSQPPDAYRDYVVARNIVKYSEHILVGPWNGVFDALASPAYNYLLAAVLMLNERMSVLSLFNIFIQVLGILCVYWTARVLFSPGTGLIAALLYSFDRAVLQQSFWVFQPYMMQPFLYASYLCLALAYARKSHTWLAFGGFLAIVAGVLHNSAFTELPLVVFLGCFIIRKLSGNRWHYAVYIGVMLDTLFLAHFSALMYLSRAQGGVMSAFSHKFIGNSVNYFWNLLTNVSIVTHLNSEILYDVKRVLLFQGIVPNILAVAVIVLCIWYFCSPRVDKARKFYLCAMLCAVALPLLLASFLAPQMYGRRFLLILGPFMIATAEIVNTMLSKKLIFNAAKVVMIILLVKSFAVDVSVFLPVAGGREPPNVFKSAALSVVADKILEIKKDAGYLDLSFFQLYLYPDTPIANGYTDAEYWLGVEEQLKLRGVVGSLKFLKNDEGVYGVGYRTLNEGRYVFVICNAFIQGVRDDCINDYRSVHSDQAVVKNVFSQYPYAIYLTEKKPPGEQAAKEKIL